MQQSGRRVFRISDLVRQGMSPDQIQKLKREGSYSAVRHGAVVEGPLAKDLRSRQIELIQATLPALSKAPGVLTHTSAVALLGLPMTNRGAEQVWLNRPRGSSKHRRPQIITRACALEPDEIMRIGSYLVTSPERTAVDMAREFDFPTGVMIADAVLRGSGSVERMQELLRRAPRRRGNVMAQAVAAFADGRSESPGESLMRAQLELHQCPAPDLQVGICTPLGEFVARCDFGWPNQRVVGEYDGPQKYGRLLKPGQTVSDVVVHEKEREANIRDQGWEIIRFCRADLRNPVAAAARLIRLLDSRSAQRRGA